MQTVHLFTAVYSNKV